MGKKKLGAGALVVLAMALVAPLAEATETTRAEYVAAVEPICQSNTQANERILKGVKAEVKKGKLKPASRQLAKAAAALRKTLGELEAVPKPPADQVRLTKWLGFVKTEASLLQKSATKLKAGDRTGATAMQVRLEHNANLANNVVVDFEFHYCRFEPSKYT